MSASVEYKGYTIRFSENEETWNCSDIDYYSNASLAAVKRRIDSLHLKMRKESAVPCLVLEMYNTEPRFVEGVIVEYDAPIRSQGKSFERVYTGPVVDHSVAVMAQRRGNERASRSKEKLSSLYPSTPENFAILNQAAAHYREAKEAEQKMHAVLQRLVPIEYEAISGIVQASDYRFQEGEAQ